ncbi:polysaccharide deacetylase family protein [Fusobacterium varium]|nr:hypothetical protein [Fusobacterium varium]EES62917.1 hypothetical protein FVAG_00606 [Fusobacterium varium ATCC 27725]VEH39625.1 Uncharacterised protein [Fusobacterium varium]
MDFTYKAYKGMIEKLLDKNYEISDYKNYKEKKKVVILRHDIDTSLEKALRIAEIEKELNVYSTYFILLSTDFYNINSEKSLKIVKEIKRLGGKIGLHFDEKKYKINDQEDYIKYVNYELDILSSILNEKIDIVSMHRPSKEFLEMDLEIPNVINSYQKVFFNKFKYISDSRMNWRENVEEIIEKNQYKALHILIHPFWYEENEKTMEEKLKIFLNGAIWERYNSLNENIRNFEEILSKEILNDYQKV